MLPQRVAERLGLERVDHCENCGELCTSEVVRFIHEFVDYPERQAVELTFCSAACWQEYMQVIPKMELDRRFRKEANFLYRMICPACKNRFQRAVAAGTLEDE